MPKVLRSFLKDLLHLAWLFFISTVVGAGLSAGFFALVGIVSFLSR